MTTQIRRNSIVVLAMGLILNLYADSTHFDFNDPKGVNSMSISVDSMVEPIMGTAAGISGNIIFDPEAPEATTGKIVVSAAAIETTNDRMTKVLHSEDWIDVEKYPTVEFLFKAISNSKKTGETMYKLDVRGDFTLKGVTKETTIPVTVSHLPGKLSTRQSNANGDLLIIRTNFTIPRKDFNIKPEMDGTTVGETIAVNVGIVGSAPKQKEGSGSY